MFFALLIQLNVVYVSANYYETEYRLVEGTGAIDIVIKYCVIEIKNSKSVGVRSPPGGVDTYEPLSFKWMKTRDYQDGYSYYEKFRVIERFTTHPPVVNGSYEWKIQGPVEDGTRVVLRNRMPDPFSPFFMRMVDYRFPDDIILLLEANWGVTITFSTVTGGVKQQHDSFDIPEIIIGGTTVVMVIDFYTDLVVFTFAGVMTFEVVQKLPGDEETKLQLVWEEREPHTFRAEYHRNFG